MEKSARISGIGTDTDPKERPPGTGSSEGENGPDGRLEAVEIVDRAIFGGAVESFRGSCLATWHYVRMNAVAK